MPPKSNRNPTNRSKNGNENIAPRLPRDTSPPNTASTSGNGSHHRDDLATTQLPTAHFNEITNTANLPSSALQTTTPQLDGTAIPNGQAPPFGVESSPGDEPDDDATLTSSTHSPPPLNERYDLRSSTSDSIYNQMESLIFSKPLFLGHEDALKGVTLTLDRKNNGTFLQDGAIYKSMVFGEVAPRGHGSRTTARGDKRPPNDPVRNSIQAC